MTSLYRKITVALSLVTLFLGSFTTVSAYEFYSYPTYPSYSAYDGYGGYYQDQTAYVRYLQEVIMQMLADRGVSTAYPVQSSVSGYSYGAGPYTFRSVDPSAYSYSPTYSIDEEPYVRTYGVRDVEDESAELRGEVDMNDFGNGIVFFAYGQNENTIEDIESDYDEYDDVEDDEDGDDLQVVRVDSDLDTDDYFEEEVEGLDSDEEYFYVICVEFENDDNDEELECGDVEDFETDDDDDSDNEGPEIEIIDIDDIRDDQVDLEFEVDMNDFSNGFVFIAWGEDEDSVEGIEDEDEYDDIDEDGEDLQVYVADTDLDTNDDFAITIVDLDDDTDHYVVACVEYEDEDDDIIIECTDVEEFTTDED